MCTERVYSNHVPRVVCRGYTIRYVGVTRSSNPYTIGCSWARIRAAQVLAGEQGGYWHESTLDNPKYAAVVRHFEQATAASREHSKQATMALQEYGDEGATIAGVVREHFPTDVKDRLRELAQQVTVHSDAAYAARPKRTRIETIRRIGELIARRDGSGFYGPRG